MRNSIINYAAGGLGVSIVSLLTVLIFARIFNENEYSIYLLNLSIVVFISNFSLIGANAVIMKSRNGSKRDWSRFAIGFFYFFSPFVSASLFLLAYILFVYFELFAIDFNSLFIFFSAIFETFFLLNQAELLAFKKSKEFGVRNVVKVCLNLIIFLVLILLQDYSIINGAFLSFILTSFMFFLYSSKTFFVKLIYFFQNRQSKYIKFIKLYIFSISINNLSRLMPNFVDKLFASTITNSSVASLALTQQISRFLMIPSTAIIRGYTPQIFSDLSSADIKVKNSNFKNFNKLLFLSALYLIFITLTSFFVSDVASLIFGNKYTEIKLIASIMVFDCVFTFNKNVLLIFVKYDPKLIKLLPISTYTYLGIFVLLAIFLIGKYSIVGLAIALVVSKYISSIIMFFFAQKYLKKIDNMKMTFLILILLPSIIFIAKLL
ncbi:hypothetical protein OAH81_03645 [Candidatus Pseudothioglobus singularis]|nr:hypothetical protein [Candidatus Pseudothioglobus singularis]MDB4822113.1 hypothetical protein [Candidatus Pseudothioglobus singularis]